MEVYDAEFRETTAHVMSRKLLSGLYPNIITQFMSRLLPIY